MDKEQKTENKETKSKADIREEKRKKAKLKNITQRVVKYALWGLVLAVIVYGIVLMVRSAEPDGEDYSTAHTIQGRQHIAQGASHPEYNSNPPSSGWHYASPARTGFYTSPLPDEQVIHNLEHGDIWIAYHPSIDQAALEVLESYAGRYVVVSPREANDGDISLVAWGRVDTFDVDGGAVDETRIRDFIKRYDNRGPEKVRTP